MNPVPYVRTTHRAKWVNKSYLRYRKFAELVQRVFCLQNNLIYDKGPPIKGRCFYGIDVLVGFKSGNHGDLDNIVKGLLDSLFEQDKGCLKMNVLTAFTGKSFISMELVVWQLPCKR